MEEMGETGCAKMKTKVHTQTHSLDRVQTSKLHQTRINIHERKSIIFPVSINIDRLCSDIELEKNKNKNNEEKEQIK